MKIIILTFAIVVLLCIVTKWIMYNVYEKQEAIESYEEEENSMLNEGGVALTTDACVAITDQESPYVFRGVPYLRRHPTALDKCVFVKTQDPKIMGSNLAACDAASSMFAASSTSTDTDTDTDAVLASVGKEIVDGSQQCVLTFKSGLSKDDYGRFEASLREKAIKQSAFYTKLSSDLAALKKKRVELEHRIRQQRRTLQTALDLRAARNAEINNLTPQLSSILDQVNQETAEVARLTDLIKKETENANSLEKQANTKENQQRSVTTDKANAKARYDQAVSTLQTTAAMIQTQRSQLDGVIRDINNANSTISNLNTEINNYSA